VPKKESNRKKLTPNEARKRLGNVIDKLVGGERGRLASRFFDQLEPEFRGAPRGTVPVARNPDDQLEVTVTRRELSEIVGALYDNLALESAERKARYWRERWEKLDLRLREAKHKEIRPVLRAFELGREGHRIRVLRERLEMARDYVLLTCTRRLVHSPERAPLFGPNRPRGPRAFGEIYADDIEEDTALPKGPGETRRGPIPHVDAVRVIEHWYGYADVLSGGQLRNARDAARRHADHPILRPLPARYKFEIPNPIKARRIRPRR
jgi:hypothetical protein